MQLGSHLVEEPSHGFFAIEHVPGFFVTLDIVFNLLLKILVDALILKNAQKTLVNLAIEQFVLIGQLQVFLSQVLTLQSGLVEFCLTGAD